MTRGKPDDSNVLSAGNQFDQESLSELIARLGGTAILHRSGNVIWRSDWQRGIGGVQFASSYSASDPVFSLDYAYSAGLSLKLAVPASANAYHTCFGSVPPLDLTRYAIHVVAACETDADSLVIALDYYSGMTVRRFALRLDPASNSVYYRNDAGGWTLLSDTLISFGDYHIFHAVTLLIDLSDLSYVQAVIDRQKWELSGIVPQATPYASVEHFDWAVQITAVNANAYNVYIDEVVLLQNDIVQGE